MDSKDKRAAINDILTSAVLIVVVVMGFITSWLAFGWI